ncbi:helix-turn-helix domain-containing protein [Nocardia abscessus]|uniref:helix-turn-helix domain-containing protein n=1 Tax=Nocardia abscessus TaxID=120957 RepID=UPI002458C591|nr:helix-turn-helix domain-containing protein [Nocardia abscessus]
MSVDLGERLQSIRKRQGLTQPELATKSGVSVSLIRKVEQGEVSNVRNETLRKLAIALRVRTSDLQVRADAEYADAETVDRWEPVRRALAGRLERDTEEPATVDGVQAELNRMRALIGDNQYEDVSIALPGLIADGDALPEVDGRVIRARLLNMAGWMLTQCRQFDTAESVLDMAIDLAEDRIEAAEVVDTKLWALLRQGKIEQTRALAIQWADDIEPKFSRATTAELSMWGRMWMRVANASVRDNRPGESEDALKMARAAAHRIGREVYADHATAKTFGPVSVAHICAESHVLDERPDRTLAIAERTPSDILHATGANRLRHRLDVANAHVQLGNYSHAIREMQEVRRVAPQWVVQQRYARDILGRIVTKRRTLTDEMRELADFVRLDY